MSDNGAGAPEDTGEAGANLPAQAGQSRLSEPVARRGLFGVRTSGDTSGYGGLLVRVPPDDTEKLIAGKHVSPMVMAGRETRGWLQVAADGVKTKRQLQSWVSRGTGYAKTLKPK